VARTMLATGAYHGSPFQHVIQTRQSFRRRLRGFDPEGDCRFALKGVALEQEVFAIPGAPRPEG
jgi:hypothetical protein